MLTRSLLLTGLMLVTALVGGCEQLTGAIPRGSTMRNALENMPTARVNVADKAAYIAWLARTSDEQMLGLMNVTEAELAADRGMLFIFDYDRYQSFWMRNTIIPLDIAYVRSDGTIVKTYTMKALDESGYPSLEPARFVLEVRAGQFAENGVHEGDRVEIPPEALNSSP